VSERSPTSVPFVPFSHDRIDEIAREVDGVVGLPMLGDAHAATVRYAGVGTLLFVSIGRAIRWELAGLTTPVYVHWRPTLSDFEAVAPMRERVIRRMEAQPESARWRNAALLERLERLAELVGLPETPPPSPSPRKGGDGHASHRANREAML